VHPMDGAPFGHGGALQGVPMATLSPIKETGAQSKTGSANTAGFFDPRNEAKMLDLESGRGQSNADASFMSSLKESAEKSSASAQKSKPRTQSNSEKQKATQSDPIEALILELQDRAIHDEEYTQASFYFSIASGLVWISIVVIAIILPVQYQTASDLVTQFDVMGRWLVILARSGFEYLIKVSRDADIPAFGHFPSELNVSYSGFDPWYDVETNWHVSNLTDLADEAERLHRCVVYGCSEENVPGISTSASLESFFFGSTGRHTSRGCASCKWTPPSTPKVRIL